jgi:alpha-tubulin suppressor-like RCC1 family protein
VVALLLALAAMLLAAGPASAEAPKAPTISKQPTPASLTVNEGQPASWTAAASGFPVPTAQWEVSSDGGVTWVPVLGATSPTLTIESTKTSESGDLFRAKFSSILGEAITKSVTLIVHAVPVVTEPPKPVVVEEGGNAVFKAAASGAPAPTIQWQVSTDGGTTFANVLGATSNTFTLTNVKTTISGRMYRAVFKNVAGTTDSNAALLTVTKFPAITKQPVNATVEAGQDAVFEATASGFPAPTVQWELSTDEGKTWAEVPGATSPTLTITGTVTSENGNRYRAVFTNVGGSVTSAPAVLTVHSAPAITEEPASTTVEAGEPATFEAAASGLPTPTVQWEISTNEGASWTAVSGATSDQLTIAETQLSESGDEYRVVFKNEAGSATSAPAVLTVASNHDTAAAWGANLSRQLGDGSLNALSDVPVAPVGLRFVTDTAAGGRHSLALLADGSVDAWGNDEYDQLGDGGGGLSKVPIPVSGLEKVSDIAAGANHNLALLKDGTVMAWGNDEFGQLGDGVAKESERAVAVSGLKEVKAIAAGGQFSLALLSDGTVRAWGNDESGQLGNGTFKLDSLVPVTVKGLTGVRAIAAGGEFAVAVLSNGTVEAWGSNAFGQLANAGVEDASDVPVPVESVTEATTVAAGANHALALLGGGTVVGWGEDGSGQVGNGTIKLRQETPVAVSGLSGVTAIAAGGQDSAALLASGSLMTWGNNVHGTLGDGATGSPSSVPVPVAGLAKVANISVGGSHMLAFGEPQPAVASVSPSIGPAAGGNTVTIGGADLTGATSVRFGSAEATNVTVDSATEITATAPAGTGTVDVIVVTPGGTSRATASDHYTYQHPPTVTRLLPTSGPVAGETSVTITGTEFSAATGVSFGGLPATSFKVNSTTSITAVAPAHAVGTVDVVVANSAGTSAITTKDRYKYVPVIESVAPNAGPVAGGTSVTVTGTGFALGAATIFKFGTAKATAVNCTSATSCTMLSPAHAAGTVNVTATANKVLSVKSALAVFTFS